jgi:hypothetical protein
MSKIGANEALFQLRKNLDLTDVGGYDERMPHYNGVEGKNAYFTLDLPKILDLDDCKLEVLSDASVNYANIRSILERVEKGNVTPRYDLNLFKYLKKSDASKYKEIIKGLEEFDQSALDMVERYAKEYEAEKEGAKRRDIPDIQHDYRKKVETQFQENQRLLETFLSKKLNQEIIMKDESGKDGYVHITCNISPWPRKIGSIFDTPSISVGGAKFEAKLEAKVPTGTKEHRNHLLIEGLNKQNENINDKTKNVKLYFPSADEADIIAIVQPRGYNFYKILVNAEGVDENQLKNAIKALWL